jgi:glycine/D-amino acid oxidase-like deaminating enzyme
MNRREFVSLAGGLALSAQTKPMWSATASHVVIVGAGIMGASIGYHMAKRGARVTILEKERPGAGTTQNSFAWLNAGEKRPRPYYELNMLGMTGWRRLSLEIGPDLPIQWGGCAQWLADPGSIDKYAKSVAEQESFGYSVRLIAQPELQKLLPAVSPGAVSIASFADQEGTVDPLGAAQVLLRKARDLGVVVEYPCEVTGFDTSSGRVRSVQTNQGKIEADHFVLASGNGIPPLAQAVGLTVPLVDSPGVLAHTVPLPRQLNRVAITQGVTLKQNPDGRFVTGIDFGGTPGVEPTREEGQKLLASASKYLPVLKDAKLDFVTLGHRVLPKDGHSIIGPSRTFPNIYVVATHSGMTLAPIFGQLAAAEVLDGVKVDLLESFRPDRFA